MKFLAILVVMFFQTAQASWAPIEVKEAVCEHSALVFVGSYTSINQKDYFLAAYPSLQEKYYMDLGQFSVTEILKNDQSVSFASSKDLLGGLKMLLDGRCEGGFCHMTLPHSVGASGIWLVSARHQHTGELMPLAHPSNPLPMTHMNEVKTSLKSCN